MKEKLAFITSIIILSQLVFFSSFGEEKSQSGKDLENLLKNENKFIFLTNKMGQDFTQNFGDPAKLETSDNSILIKSGTTVTLKGTQLPEYSTILVEGVLRFIETDNSSLKVQKIIVAPNGELIIGTEKNPIEKTKKVEITFVKKNEGEIGIFVLGKLSIHLTREEFLDYINNLNINELANYFSSSNKNPLLITLEGMLKYLDRLGVIRDAKYFIYDIIKALGPHIIQYLLDNLFDNEDYFLQQVKL